MRLMSVTLSARRVGSLFPAGYRWHGRVVSTYDVAINISLDTTDGAAVVSDARGGWPHLTITSAAGAMHDLAVLVARPLPRGVVGSGAPVVSDGSSVLLGRDRDPVGDRSGPPVRIDLDTGRRWTGHLPPGDLIRARRPSVSPSRIAATLGRVVTSHGSIGGFSELFRRGSGGMLVRDAAARLQVAKGTGMFASIVGLGYGLTPSGDDFVTGALLASRLAPRYGWHPPVIDHGAIRAALHATTTAGATLVYAALVDHFPHYLLGLRRAISAAARGNFAEAMARLRPVLSVGHTSGTDTVCGALWLLDRCVDTGTPTMITPGIEEVPA